MFGFNYIFFIVFISFRVLVECKYLGNFCASHVKNQKRRMTHVVKELTLQKMLDQGKSAELLREEEALRLMEQGELLNNNKC